MSELLDAIAASDDGTVRGQTFEAEDLVGCDLGRVEFEDCRFEGCLFADVRAQRISFERCDLVECDLSNARLPRRLCAVPDCWGVAPWALTCTNPSLRA